MAKNEKLPTTSQGTGFSDPFDVLHGRIDRLFQDFSRGFGLPSRAWDDGIRMPSVWGSGRAAPLMEMHEADGKITVTAELPGVDEKDIDVSVVDDVLTVSGEKKSEIEHKDGDNFRSERSYGKFSRSISLPFHIDAGKVEARFDKGVLKLTIQKPAEAEAKVKKIAIKH